MDIAKLQHKTNEYKTAADIWEYIKSRGKQYGCNTVQDAASGRKITFDELSRNVELLAMALRNLNLPSLGVGICSENNLEYTWILLGALHAGLRCTLFSPTYTGRELKHFLEVSKPDVMLCSEFVCNKSYENSQSFGSICSEFRFIRTIYVWGENNVSSAYKSLSSLLHNGDHLPSIKDQICPEDREALVLASSGSTGLAKGVILTDRAVVESLKLSSDYVRVGETVLGLMPLFHTYGLIVSFMCLCEGSMFILVPKLMGARYLSDIIYKYQIDNLFITPSLLTTIGKCPTFTKETLAHVCHVWTSAGRVSQRVQENALKVMPAGAVLHHCYGMTETIFVTLTAPYKKPESPGKVVANVECKITNGNMICGPGEIGELCFRGASIMKGYLNNEQATMEALQTDGWLKSGDLGYYDMDGYFFVVDRIKEMIKYQGNQVSPYELEEIICELPDVLEAGVVGLHNEELGELPTAGIVVRQQSKLTTEEVKEYVAKQLSSYKKLRGGVFFFEQLPKTGTGKLQRKVLLNQITNIILNSSSQER